MSEVLLQVSRGPRGPDWVYYVGLSVYSQVKSMRACVCVCTFVHNTCWWVQRKAIYKPRREARIRYLSLSPQRELTSQIPWFSTSGLQNYEMMNFWCLCHLVCGTLYSSRLIFFQCVCLLFSLCLIPLVLCSGYLIIFSIYFVSISILWLWLFIVSVRIL